MKLPVRDYDKIFIKQRRLNLAKIFFRSELNYLWNYDCLFFREIIERKKKRKCRNPGLNRGHLDLQSNALPTELFRRWVLFSHFAVLAKNDYVLSRRQWRWLLLDRDRFAPCVIIEEKNWRKNRIIWARKNGDCVLPRAAPAFISTSGWFVVGLAGELSHSGVSTAIKVIGLIVLSEAKASEWALSARAAPTHKCAPILCSVAPAVLPLSQPNLFLFIFFLFSLLCFLLKSRARPLWGYATVGDPVTFFYHTTSSWERITFFIQYPPPPPPPPPPRMPDKFW